MTDAVAPPTIGSTTPSERRGVPRLLERGAAYSWRLLVIAAAVVALLYLIGQLLVVVIPVAVAVLLTRALSPVAGHVRRIGLRPALAAAATLLGFLVALAAVVTLVGWAVAGEIDDLGPTLSDGIDEITTWLVEDGPFDISQADIDRWREQAGDALSEFVGSGNASLVSGAVVAAEVVIGVVLALIVTFFFLKDGRRMMDSALDRAPRDRRDLARRTSGRAWDALGGYLRGAALLGLVEAVIIGITSLLVGSGLVVPVMVVTFLAAFVPLVGAVAAGVVAVLVALVTAGVVPALIVLAVAIVVQQLDNDLLAPVIYGRALKLHPLVILLGIAAGGSLFGFVGTVFAVPVLAVSFNVVDEIRRRPGEQPTGAEPAEVSGR